MVLMQTHINTANALRARFGMEENSTWANISAHINIPIYTPANIILEYAAMNNSVSVKQADVVLVDDFLDYPNPYSLSDLDCKSRLDRYMMRQTLTVTHRCLDYAGKQSANGPG